MPTYPQYKMDLEGIFEPIVNILKASLLAKLEAHLVNAFISADRELVTWGKTLGGIPISYEGPPIEQAIEWARKHCATLVTKMDDETKARLAQVVSEAIENKSGIPELKRTLKAEFNKWMEGATDKLGRPILNRAQMIARTETANALSQGSLDRMKAMEVTGKEWVATADACDICLANEDEGVVPIDHVFSSGDERPGAHPNCRCALAPAMLKEE